MKHFFLIVTLLSASLLCNSQTNTVIFENFESSVFPPEEWNLIDYDGDGNSWYHREDSETYNKLASSKSWDGSALTPHNIIATSEIDFTNLTSEQRLRLSYKIAATGNNYYNEHYKVVLSTQGNTYEDFEAGTILMEETLEQEQSGWNLTTRYIEMEEYAGETFWLAWVHYNCSDEDAILLDDIHIYEGEDPEGDPPYVSWIVGSDEDSTTENHLPGVVLAGGGGDNDDAMTWFLNRADGGDIVVLRATGSDGYNDYLFSSLGVTVNSVETILINSLEAAQNPYVEQQIRNAEGLFIAGGDQYDYYQFWKDTPVMDAINYLINEKGVTVGGTSAGMAILGKVYYAPDGSSAQSETVLANPYHSSMSILGRNDFINIQPLGNTITDTHFDQRERAGRFFTFLARMFTDWEITARGIAANEYTAVCIDTDGKAYVYGNPSYEDYAYFAASQECAPETCLSNQPLTWNCSQKAVKVYRVLGKKSDPSYFDLSTWNTGEGGEWFYWYSVDGVLTKQEVGTNVNNTEMVQLNIYPNPAKSSIWVSSPKQGRQLIEIVNNNGQIVCSRELYMNANEPTEIHINHIQAGFYLVKINNGFYTEYGKLVIGKMN